MANKKGSRFVRRGEADELLLKQDMSFRLAEAANDAKSLFRAVTFQQGNVFGYLQKFMETFFALYDQTKEQLDEKERQIVESGGEIKINGTSREVESIEDWFSEPIQLGKNREGKVDIDVVTMAKEGLKHYRLYKELLRKSGILDLAKVEHEQRGIGGK